MLSLYIHYPFCLSKCPYCDFNSYRISTINEEDYLRGYLTELQYYYNKTKNRKIGSIFFGGGTPSLMSVSFLKSLIEKINDLWGIDSNIEISMEANPTTVEINKFQNFKDIGINRLSIGIQSLNNNELKFFGRIHNAENGIQAIKIAQKVFKDRYSIDLIYARPNQNLNEWIIELDKAIKLSPYHLSLYQLIIEEGTIFYKKNIKPLDDKKSNELYDRTNEILEKNNLHLYEVSNYAQNGYECKHNINYWNSGEWIGIGAGAHGRICFNDNYLDNYKIRTAIENIKLPQKWLENVLNKGYGYELFETLAKNEFIEEIILMGLRKKEGIFLEDVQKYLHIDDISNILNSKNLKFLKEKKFIDVSKNNVKVNFEHFNILDSIIEKLLP